MARQEKVYIDKLERNELQTRVALDETTVNEYAESMHGGAKMPPVIVFYDGVKYHLADGFHRVEAALRAGFKTIKAEVRSGGYADALKHAIGANAEHGLRRSNADKRRALTLAWENRTLLFDGAEPSLQMLADMANVSKKFVQNFKNETSSAPPSPWHGAIVTTTQNPINKGDGECENSENQQKSTFAVMDNPPPPPAPPTRRVMGKDGIVRNMPPAPPRKRVPSPIPPPPAPPENDYSAHAPGVMVDRFDHEIPENLEHAFESREIGEILHDLSGIRTRIRAALDRKDTAFAHMSQRVLISLDAAYSDIKAAKPYCVCRICQGVDGCRACSETGFQNEDQFRRNPPEVMPANV